MPVKKRKQPSAIVRTTDDQGAVVFENVPINNYVIMVEESRNFMGNNKLLNLISERTIQPSFSVFIELKPQISSFVELALSDEGGYKAENATVTALLLATTEIADTDRKNTTLIRVRIFVRPL